MSHDAPAIGIDIGGSSVKAALLAGKGSPTTAKSERYSVPSRDVLDAAVRTAIQRLGPATSAARVGLCVPGIRSEDGLTVVESVNLPALNGVDLRQLVHRTVGATCQAAVATSDVHATAVDIHAQQPTTGRLLVIAIGTGVGACVLDNGVMLKLTGASSGHLGQIDVSLDIPGEMVPTGRDGGRGSLEAYIGLPALEDRYGGHFEHVAAVLDETSPPIRALARALRIAHAIYRPDRIVLAGGIGALLTEKVPLVRAMIDRDLTKLARPGWKLEAASDVFHAAVGAARLAAG